MDLTLAGTFRFICVRSPTFSTEACSFICDLTTIRETILRLNLPLYRNIKNGYKQNHRPIRSTANKRI